MNPLLSPDVQRNPFPLYEIFRQSQPVRYLDGLGVWGVFRYDTVKTVLSDHERFRSGQGAGGLSLLMSDPPRHTQLRSLVSRAFTPKTISALEPHIEQLTHGLLDQVEHAGQFDLIRDLAYPLPVIVIAELLGIPVQDRERFKQWSDMVVASADVLVGGSSHGSYSAYMEMYAYFQDIMNRRRNKPGDGDLISALLSAEDDEIRLSEQDILSFCVLLLVAGNETTTNLIGNTILTLLEHPEQMEEAASSPALLNSGIEEVLRYRSPVQAMFRTTSGRVELDGQRLPAGTRLIAFIGSANRDEDKFPDAQRFDMTRSPNPHLAFGHGIHYCLGAPLARLETRIAVDAVLKRFPELARVNDDPLPPAKGFIVHGFKQLPLRFSTRLLH